jgi:HAE1 family hydrophobic/amphiphilic exporter-1
MNLSALSVRRGVTFGMVFAAVFGFGVYSLGRLQLDLYPDMTFPMVLVLTNYTGASPEDVETLVTEPIEAGVASAKGVESITSQSKQGASVVSVEFDWDKDMDQAETDVRRKLELVQGLLPDDADDPLVLAMDPSMQPIAIMALEGAYPLDELRRIAEDDVCDRVERLDGVASCEAIGGLDREIRVALDPVRLAAHGLDAAAVLGAIGRENAQEPGGTIEQGPFAFNIQTRGKLRSLDDLRSAVVGQRVGADGTSMPIRLRQVAEVTDAFNEPTRVIEVDGKPSVWVVVRKQSGENTVKAAEATLAEVRKIEAESEGRLRFGTIFNQADFINASLGNLSTTALMAVGISFVVLLLFLGNVRSSLIVATAIPLSVVATFFVMDRADMTLNVISMAGLALAVGMLIDNAIVVLENIFRLRQEGLPIREAAVRGAAEVSTAVTASTLTTVAVFVPVLFVPGIAGVLFKDMAVTICFALLVSLLVAVSFVPLAASRLLGPRARAADTERVARWNPIGRVAAPYARLLGWVLRHRWVVPVGLAAALFVTGVLAAALPTEFMMEQDQSMIQLTTEAPVGSNLEETRRFTGEAVAALMEVIPASDRKLIAAEIGSGEGFSAIFSKGAHSATLRVPLAPISGRATSQAAYEDLLRTRLADIPDLKTTASGMHMTGSADMEIMLRGHDLGELRRVGREIEARARALPQVAEAEFSFADPTPQLTVEFDRDKASALGASTSGMGQAVATYFLGRTAGFFSEGGDEHPIVVRYDKADRRDVEQLSRAPIALPGGTTVPLGNLARVALEPGPVSIERIDQERAATLSLTLKESWKDDRGKERQKDLGGAIGVVETMLRSYEWPEGMGYEVGGTAEDFIESFSYLGLALVISVLLVYMVMAAQFESFRQPFIILFTVPLAFIGVVLAFVLTGSPLDVSALIGVIMLVGIVVNNGIVMIDAANQQRAAGLDRFRAIIVAARTRLRPVLLTSLTTICSMIPLALEIGDGSESWSGMARAVIGGLTSATVLTLVVVPMFYTVFARKEVAV